MLSVIPNTPATAIYAMLAAGLLPFVFTILAKSVGGFTAKDNKNPRAFLANTTGLAARANAVQQNSFETLPIFLASVLCAMYIIVPQSIINQFAWLYVFIRIGYGVAYIMNWSLFRSVLWALSMACIVLLFIASIRVL